MKLGFRLQKQQREGTEVVGDVGRSCWAAGSGWEAGGDLA